MEKISFDYYYGKEADQFTFFRIPKILFTDKVFKKLSVDAKVLYGILLDRMNLSMKNKWLDEKNRVYIVYPIEEIAETFGCGTQKATKILQELDEKKGIGLVEKKRLGLGKPNILYVKNFIINGIEKTTESSPEKITKPDLLKSQFKNSENHNSGMMNNTKQELLKSQGNNTNINKTDYSNTDFNNTTSIFSKDKPIEELKRNREEDLKEKIKDNISYEKLIITYPNEERRIDLILSLVTDLLISKNPLKINGNYETHEKVKEKFLDLEFKHIVYVLDYLNKVPKKQINNLKAYLLTILFNADENLKLEAFTKGQKKEEKTTYDQDARIWNEFLNNS
ncbi:replication initiator protein A [Enterococcus faecalis]|uniref:replication initiator protein A n=1 Tax=Enterococcus faecalis TaxID=1351 RepID=UPI00338E4104